MTKKFFLYAIAALAALQSVAAQPRLIVQIVVGSMRGEDLDRYAANFGEGGFRRLTEGGTVYADSRYDYLQTTTPVSLATLTTGAMPSTHGVIGSRWVDYTTNRTVELTAGRRSFSTRSSTSSTPSGFRPTSRPRGPTGWRRWSSRCGSTRWRFRPRPIKD